MNGRRNVAALVAGSIVGLLAVVMLAAGGWALSKDRFSRDSDGFLSIVSGQLQTGTYALASELRGDGPGWLYGSTVFGEARFHATSRGGKHVFVGIARTVDVERYLAGTGYATIEHLDTGAVTTHAGGTPSVAPSRLPIWAAATTGAGEQTLRWDPRDGDWSILVMNADATAGVAVSGDVSAKAPILPWLALGLLLAAAALGAIGAWLLVHAIRAGERPVEIAGNRSQGSGASRTPSGAGA